MLFNKQCTQFVLYISVLSTLVENAVIQRLAVNSDFVCGVPRIGSDDPFGLVDANSALPKFQDFSQRSISNISLALTIVGGTDASFGEICWQAKLHRDGFFICGGSIIGRRTILTASHCVINFGNGQTNAANRFKVVVGAMTSAVSMQTGDSNGCAQEFQVSKITSNPKFNRKTNENDMAIITLNEDIDFSMPCVCPICLRPKIPDVGEICSVSGYGLEKEGGGGRDPTPLKSVHLNILPTQFGGNCFIQKDASGPNLNNIMCAGDVSGQDSCQGDSGGPVVCFDPTTRTHYQAGLVSYGIGCGRGIGGVYTRLSSYLNFIRSSSNNDADSVIASS